jgi:hypothetical protein
MSWFEQKIRAYEQMRWEQEPNRTRLPFAWGLEYIGGTSGDPEPRAYFDGWVDQTLANSDEWYSIAPAPDYSLDDNVLTFTSQIESPWPENNRVYGQLFRARKTGPAVIVLAQWNSRWEEQQDICRYLNHLGITAIKLSLPYHDRRSIPGHPRADHLVGPNVGLTIQAGRQSVLDVRRCAHWLTRHGYDRLGILGTSIGSCIAFIAMCHEPALRAGAFLHVSTYFADVVAAGLTTSNVWESLRTGVSLEELRRYWSPISPFPYISRLYDSRRSILAISGRYDPTFPFELTEEFHAAVSRDHLRFESMSLPCGHYSLGVAPFKYAVGLRFGAFLFRALA